MADKKQMWIDWTHDALSGYTRPEDIEDPEDIADDMADVASRYADAMTEEFDERFGAGTPRRRRKTKATKDDEED